MLPPNASVSFWRSDFADRAGIIFFANTADGPWPAAFQNGTTQGKKPLLVDGAPDRRAATGGTLCPRY